jgi:hypothetical protein
MRKLTIAAFATVAILSTACKKTGEGEYQVQTPDIDASVSTDTNTIKTPTVDAGMKKDTIVVDRPTVDVKPAGTATPTRKP